MSSRLVNTIKKVKYRFSSSRYDWYYGNIIFKMDINSANFKLKAKQKIPYINKPGISFSFDDSFRVEHWYKYGKELFGYYDVKATFNINAFHHFENQREHTQEEIDMLLDLQANGHEIAHHGYKHENAILYSTNKGISRWIEDDIKTMFSWMENQSHSITKEKFKKPVTYAFPFAKNHDEHIKELVPKYFKIVRGHKAENELLPLNYTGFAPSISIDSTYLTNVKYVKKIMKIAKNAGANLIFMCHSLLPKEMDWNDFQWGEEAIEAGRWRISVDTIQEIILEAKKLNLEFYTTAEIAGVATFIDKNLERAIRKYLSKPLDTWISISDLIHIKELDLSGENISNLDGIQYLINLEKLHLKNNHISDFRLLEKLHKLKDVDISNNYPLNIVKAI